MTERTATEQLMDTVRELVYDGAQESVVAILEKQIVINTRLEAENRALRGQWEELLVAISQSLEEAVEGQHFAVAQAVRGIERIAERLATSGAEERWPRLQGHLPSTKPSVACMHLRRWSLAKYRCVRHARRGRRCV